MSLLKAFDLKRSIIADTEALEKEFLATVDAYEGDKESYITLLGVYGLYAVEYLAKSAATLKKDQSMQDTMQLMNSYIAEVGNDLGLKYYNKETGVTIVDLVVQNTLSEGELNYNYIEQAIEKTQESYSEEEGEDNVH